MYDNDLGMFVDVPWLHDGQWFEDSNGNMYIVPVKGVSVEIEGADSDIMQALLESCKRNGGIVAAEDAKHLGLKEISHQLKRFDPEKGYYHA